MLTPEPDHDGVDLSHASSEDRVAILYSPNTGGHEVLLHSPIYQSTYSENISYTHSDSKNLEKFLLKESSVPASKRLCLEHRAKCQAWEIINRTDHAVQSQLINNMYNNISAYELPDGTFQIKHTYLYRNDPAITYAPEFSNIIEASCHSKNTVK